MVATPAVDVADPKRLQNSGPDNSEGKGLIARQPLQNTNNQSSVQLRHSQFGLFPVSTCRMRIMIVSLISTPLQIVHAFH
jgi:hypothetical protein